MAHMDHLEHPEDITGADAMLGGLALDDERERMSEQDALFNAYFEGDMTPEEREAFTAALDADDALRQDYDYFVDIMGGLRNMPLEFAPDTFVHDVQARIRTRSRGRFFAESHIYNLYRSRVPYEVIAIVMILVMAASYLLMEAPRDRDVRNGDLTVDRAKLDKSGEHGKPTGD